MIIILGCKRNSLILLLIVFGMGHALGKGMRWADEIRVRTQPQKEKEVLELLLESVESVNRNRKPKSACVYSHHSEPGGFSLILVWDTASVPMQGSDTARLILEGLKPLGLLDHTVLVERRVKKLKGVKEGGCSQSLRTRAGH